MATRHSPRRATGGQDGGEHVKATVAQDLDIARDLARAGIPVFVAYPDPAKPGDYTPPKGWQNTTANPAYVSAWKPGRALCAIMGHGLDLVDIDPRNGGDAAALNGVAPEILGAAASPSGGAHLFVNSMGVGSRNGVLPGIDVKAGTPGGTDHGFAFIAPTVRASKTTGERAAYRWTMRPDLGRLRDDDTSGQQLADLVRRARGGRQAADGTAPFQQSASGWDRHTGPVNEGGHHDALVSYAGWMRKQGLPLRPQAEALLRLRLADLVPGAAPVYTEAEALAELHDVYSRYEAGDPVADAAEAMPAEELDGIASKYAPVNWHEAWSAQPDQIDWLLEPMLERGTINALFAKPGTGKSLLALEICARLSISGITVVYIDDENRVSDVVERLQAFGCMPEQLDRLRFYSFAGLPALDTAPGGIHLRAIADANAAGLVVLDTTTRLVAGRENDSDTFLQLYRCSLVPLKAQGITVLRLDHPGKDIARGQRGSSAKDGDVDTIWRLEEITPTRFRLEREKTRNSHGSGMVELHRLSEPLRHEWNQFGNCPEILIATKLDRLGVPADAGRPAVRKALSDAGVKASNDLLTATIRYRRNRPGQSADSPDSSAGDRLSVRTPNRYG